MKTLKTIPIAIAMTACLVIIFISCILGWRYPAFVDRFMMWCDKL